MQLTPLTPTLPKNHEQEKPRKIRCQASHPDERREIKQQTVGQSSCSGTFGQTTQINQSTLFIHVAPKELKYAPSKSERVRSKYI